MQYFEALAAGDDWWRWRSEFTEYVDAHSSGAVYKGADPSSWSGGNSHADRGIAAQALVNWRQVHLSDELLIVAHSHGANVASLASRSGLRIDRLICLGAPIRTDCPPDMRNVSLLANVYSHSDRVQTPFGTFPLRRGEGRTLGDDERLVNIPLFNFGHSELHEPWVWAVNHLEWLLK